VAFAQDEERRAPPIEIPDFSNLDEYIYEPRSTVRFGFRFIGGAKTSFAGQGRIPSPEDPGPATGANQLRAYHDGRVQPDARTVARLDSGGNPIIDPQSNSAVFDPIAPDGKTNTWNYTDASQLSLPGYVRFSSYSAEVVDTTAREKKTNSTAGMDLSVSRDMGKLFGGRIPWNLTAGMSVNDLSANKNDFVRATLSTVSDYYSLYGITPPDAPYSSPSSVTENVVDAAGNSVLGSDGVAQTITVDTSVLLGNERPGGRRPPRPTTPAWVDAGDDLLDDAVGAGSSAGDQDAHRRGVTGGPERALLRVAVQPARAHGGENVVLDLAEGKDVGLGLDEICPFAQGLLTQAVELVGV
jgi:hypothetical protein